MVDLRNVPLNFMGNIQSEIPKNATLEENLKIPIWRFRILPQKLLYYEKNAIKKLPTYIMNFC